MYVFLSGLGLLVVVGLHQLLESRKVKWFLFVCVLGSQISYSFHYICWLPNVLCFCSKLVVACWAPERRQLDILKVPVFQLFSHKVSSAVVYWSLIS